MTPLDERHTADWLQRNREGAADVVAERVAAKSKSDELRSIGSFSVLSEPDRKTINDCRRWMRFLWQQGTSPQMDVIEHDGVHDLMCRLDDLYMRTSPEPQLSRAVSEAWINAQQQAHAREMEGACSGCGGRTINGTCLRNCDRD